MIDLIPIKNNSVITLDGLNRERLELLETLSTILVLVYCYII
jgi:hypothetical protein